MGSSSKKATTTQTTSNTNTTTTIGEIGLTGSNAVELARILGQESVESQRLQLQGATELVSAATAIATSNAGGFRPFGVEAPSQDDGLKPEFDPVKISTILGGTAALVTLGVVAFKK